MRAPPGETRYASAERGVRIGNQVIGDGPIDTVFVPDFTSNVDVWWDLPQGARFLERPAAASRLMMEVR